MSSADVSIALFALCGLGILYPHIIYPVILRAIVALEPKAGKDANESVVHIDICVAAFNEESHIAETLHSIDRAIPDGVRGTIHVGSDGSTDRTVEIASTIRTQRCDVVTHDLPRLGKNATINYIVGCCTTEIIIFTDADCTLEKDALQYLLLGFTKKVGCVIGCNDRTLLRDVDTDVAQGEATYRANEDRTNQLESILGCCVASNGALYAIRRNLFLPISNGRMADDYANVLAVLSQDYRVVFERRARVFEQRETEMQDEFRRTARTVAGGLSTTFEYRRLLSPSRGKKAFILWSHRVVRWLSPFFLIIAIVVPFLAISQPTVFGCMYYGQALFYATAFLGHVVEKYGMRIPGVSTVRYFVVMNIAILWGWIKFFRSARLDVWLPTGSTA